LGRERASERARERRMVWVKEKKGRNEMKKGVCLIDIYIYVGI